MGSRNLKQRSLGFAKGLKKGSGSKLAAMKRSMVRFIERIAGRPVTKASKKRAAMSITSRPEFVCHITRGIAAPAEIASPTVEETSIITFETAEPVAEIVAPLADDIYTSAAPEKIETEPVAICETAVEAYVEAEAPKEIPTIITIESNEPYYESIAIEQPAAIVESAPAAEAITEDAFEDEFDVLAIHGIAGMAATSSAATTQTTLSSFVMDFDDWDVPEESSVPAEVTAATAVEVAEPADIITEEAPIGYVYEETPEEKKFFEDLYEDILAHCLYEDVIPSVAPEVFEFYAEMEFISALYDKLADESVKNDILPRLVPELFGTEETVVPETEEIKEEPAPTTESPIESFVDGSVHFSFGYSKSKVPAGPTKITFIMGDREEIVPEETCDEEIKANTSNEPVMAAHQSSAKLYL